MRSIFELISKYRSDLITIPLIAFAAIIVTLFIYIFFNKKKYIKYLLGAFAIVVGLVFLIQGYRTILDPVGLDLITKSASILVFGFVSVFFAAIMDLFDMIGHGFKKDKRQRRLQASKKKPKKSKKVNRGQGQGDTKAFKADKDKSDNQDPTISFDKEDLDKIRKEEGINLEETKKAK